MLVKKDSTNVSVELYIIDDTAGTPETGVVWNTAGIDLNYRRDGAVVTSITEATLAALTTAHTDGGFLHVANGRYRLDVPDAAFATGVSKVTIGGTVTGMVVIPKEVQLVAFDPDDATSLGLTQMPADLTHIHGTALTETSGQLAGRFVDFFDHASFVITTLDELDTAQDTRHDETQAAVDSIGAASGGSVNIEATEDNTGGAIDPSSAAFVGSVQSGTYASTEQVDGVLHDIDDTANDIDIVYGFDVAGSRVATALDFAGFCQGNTDEIKVKVYDHVGADWEIIATLAGQVGTTNTTLTPASPTLFLKHTGTGAELGKVYIRFETDSTTPSNLSIDQLSIGEVSTSLSVGYADGAIWIDTNNGTAGTETYVNGVADNPVDTWADALTLSASLNIKRFQIANGSSIQLSAATEECTLIGENWELDLNGQSIKNSYFHGCDVQGIGTAVSGEQVFDDCHMSHVASCTIPDGTHLENCGIEDGGSLIFGTGTISLHSCYNATSSTAIMDFGAATGNTSVENHNWRGPLEIQNMGQAGTDIMRCSATGYVTLNANCVGGTFRCAGNLTITDNSATTTIIDTARIAVDQVNEQCDTALSDWGKTGFALSATGMDAVTLPADIITAASINTAAFTADAFAANALVAATFAAASLEGKGDWNTVTPDAAGTVPIDGTLSVTLANGVTHGGNSAILQMDGGIQAHRTSGIGFSVQSGDNSAVNFIGNHATKGGFEVSNVGAGPDMSMAFGNFTGTVSGNSTHDAAAVLTALGDGTWASEAGGTGNHLTDLGGMSTGMKAEVNTEADTALTDYDAPTNTEMLAAHTTTDGLIGAPEVSIQAELNALANKFVGITAMADWLAFMMGSNSDAPTKAEFNARTAGEGVDNTTDSGQAVADSVIARTLLAAAYFDPAVDAVANVTLVDTTTTNTDMVGTDGANTTVPDAAGTAAGLHTTTDAAIAALNNLDAAGIRTAVGLASANMDTQFGLLATEAKQDIVDALLDRVAVLCVGNVTDAGTGTEVFTYGGVTATVTVDGSGNRTLAWS